MTRRAPTPVLLAVLLSLPLAAAAWGGIDDIRYKLKGSDGNLWAPYLARCGKVRGDERPGAIAFTFDDGPDHRTTPILLDELDRHGIKAAFFVNGHRVHWKTAGGAENRSVLREIHRRGHFIGNHTFSHADVTALDDRGWSLEVRQVTRIVRGITGRRPWLFRPPFGRLGDEGMARLAREGYTVVMWKLDPLDWKAETPTELLEHTRRVIEENPKGGVILFHDTNRNTVESFGLIVEWIRERNARLAARGEQGLEIVGLESFVRRR